MVVAIRWAAVQFVLCVRRHGVANAFNLGIVGGQLVVIRALLKGNPPAPVVMQGDAVSGYGF